MSNVITAYQIERLNTATSVSNDGVFLLADGGEAKTVAKSTMTADIVGARKWIGIGNIIGTSAGTWATTRIAAGNYAYRKSAADETAIIAIDITPQMRVAADRGTKIKSFDVIHRISTAALDAHSVALYRVFQSAGSATEITAVALNSGTLSTATATNPTVSTVTVTTPVFDELTRVKYVVEVTVDAAATSVYDFYGLSLVYDVNEAQF